MKTIEKSGAQGDVMFIRVDEIPKTAKRAAVKGAIVVAHSETGHHHAIQADGRVELHEQDPFVCYLRSSMPMDVVHHRPFDTHETVRLTPGVWQVKRQREYTPEGFRRVED
jgi:hypothetical protein